MIDRLSHVPLIIISSHIMAYVDDHDQTTIYCISRHYRTINDTTTKSQVVPEISESKQLVLPIVPLSLAIDGDDENDAAGDMTLEVEKIVKGISHYITAIWIISTDHVMMLQTTYACISSSPSGYVYQNHK
jgi:hypothetical protein